jgi:hypothetical protein
MFIVKHEIIVKWAWEITENDEDFAALRLEDDVFIPDDVNDPPVLRALSRMAQYQDS